MTKEAKKAISDETTLSPSAPFSGKAGLFLGRKGTFSGGEGSFSGGEPAFVDLFFR